jgi:hypothetical protein
MTVVGNLIGAATVEALPKVSGRLETVSVRLGDRVTRGICGGSSALHVSRPAADGCEDDDDDRPFHDALSLRDNCGDPIIGRAA